MELNSDDIKTIKSEMIAGYLLTAFLAVVYFTIILIFYSSRVNLFDIITKWFVGVFMIPITEKFFNKEYYYDLKFSSKILVEKKITFIINRENYKSIVERLGLKKNSFTGNPIRTFIKFEGSGLLYEVDSEKYSNCQLGDEVKFFEAKHSKTLLEFA
jgi:hypothetical protein